MNKRVMPETLSEYADMLSDYAEKLRDSDAADWARHQKRGMTTGKMIEIGLGVLVVAAIAVSMKDIVRYIRTATT
jgi:hypothetical protein